MSQETRPLTERELLVRDSFTLAELALYWMIFVTFSVSLITADPRSLWALGVPLIFAPLSIANVKLHEIVHPFKIDRLWLRYGLLMLPATLIALQYIVGLIFPAIETFQFKKEVFRILSEQSTWVPVNALPGKISTTIILFGFISIFIVTLNLFIIPKSLIFFNRLLPKLCFLASTSAVFGLFLKGLKISKPPFTNGTGQSDFFAYFPYDGHWAAFACLWCGVCAAFAMKNVRNDPEKDFLRTNGPWFLTGAVILGFTGIFIDASGPGAILLLFLSLMLLLLAIEFIRVGGDQNHNSITLLATLGSCILFAVGIFRLFERNPEIHPISLLRESALKLFLERPLFGWGFESFTHVAPFYNHDTLLDSLYLSPQSDILQYLSEFGLFGCLALFVFMLLLSMRYLCGKLKSSFCNDLLLTSLAILFISAIDNPFMSPPVTISFWIVFFSALRHADIERKQVDQVDIEPPRFVSPASERRLPFFTGENKEKEI